jgi:hypothetical protein
MVCTLLAEYVSTTSNPVSSTSWSISYDPPTEIAGKECIVRLINGETSTALVTAPGSPQVSSSVVRGTTPGDLFTWASHGMANDTPLVFTVTGGTSTATTNVTYFTTNVTQDTFQLVTTKGGSTYITISANGTYTAYYLAPTRPRIPLQVRMSGISQPLNMRSDTVRGGFPNESLRSFIIGFVAMNGDCGINPSIRCMIPQGPTQITFDLYQMDTTTPVINTTQFFVDLFLQFTPV